MTLDPAKEHETYGDAFFSGIAAGSSRSADEVVARLIALFKPSNVVDVGGGAGHWAAAFLRHGVGDVQTIDGAWVPNSARAVPSEHFIEHNLALPLELGRTFELALCLEVAEHLPVAAAPQLVRTLTEAAPIVIFSAAIPGQGGGGHINEQPATFWARLFDDLGYTCYSDLRSDFWRIESVEVWYRQNILIFVAGTCRERCEGLLRELRRPDDPLLNVAHPELLVRHAQRADRLERYAGRLEQDLQKAVRQLAGAKHDLGVIINSPAWRLWQALTKPVRNMRRLIG